MSQRAISIQEQYLFSIYAEKTTTARHAATDGEEVDDGDIHGTKFIGSLLLAYKFPIRDTENERGYNIKNDTATN